MVIYHVKNHQQKHKSKVIGSEVRNILLAVHKMKRVTAIHCHFQSSITNNKAIALPACRAKDQDACRCQ